MNILSEVTTIIKNIGLPLEVGKFQDFATDEYAVLTPLYDSFEVFADNNPEYETQGVRISLYSKNNYQKRKNQIVKALMEKEITVTDRRFIGFEGNTGYYHYNIDAEKEYNLEEEN